MDGLIWPFKHRYQSVDSALMSDESLGRSGTEDEHFGIKSV